MKTTFIVLPFIGALLMGVSAQAANSGGRPGNDLLPPIPEDLCRAAEEFCAQQRAACETDCTEIQNLPDFIHSCDIVTVRIAGEPGGLGCVTGDVTCECEGVPQAD